MFSSVDIGPVTITPFGSSTAGDTYSLVCSGTVITQSDTPTPIFQWFFGPNNTSLPSGVTATATNNGNTYKSTLQFSPLSQSHTGMYICRLGGNARLAAHATVFVHGIYSYSTVFLHVTFLIYSS